MDVQGSRKKRKRAFKEVNLKDRIRSEGMVGGGKLSQNKISRARKILFTFAA
jgi:hypothetical protein